MPNTTEFHRSGSQWTGSLTCTTMQSKLIATATVTQIDTDGRRAKITGMIARQTIMVVA